MIYWVVSVKEKPIGLVRVDDHCTVKLIAGNDVGMKFFDQGRPQTEVDLDVCFQLIATDPSSPAIGEWIGHFKAKQDRKSPTFLSEAEKAEIIEFRRNGVPIKRIAQKFRVSPSTVKRAFRGA